MAKEHCTKKGGKLVEIDFEEENEGFDGDRMKRVADGGDFWATR